MEMGLGVHRICVMCCKSVLSHKLRAFFALSSYYYMERTTATFVPTTVSIIKMKIIIIIIIIWIVLVLKPLDACSRGDIVNFPT